jgi:two-component system, cell cycle sensor histidine kinase and response regulator CckA
MAVDIRTGGVGVENADAGNPVLASAFTPDSIVTTVFLNIWEPRPGAIILLVEDQAFVRNALAEALRGAGYQIVAAATAAEALMACCGKNVELLLTDLVLPGMNGCELAEKFQTIFPHAAILLMSGYTERFLGIEQSECALEYLAKPFSIPILLERIREVLNKTQLNAKPA